MLYDQPYLVLRVQFLFKEKKYKTQLKLIMRRHLIEKF